MRRLFIAVFAAALGLAMIADDAQAKRLGGGSSTGMQRDNVMKREATPAQSAPSGQSATSSQAPGASAAQAKPNRSGLWGMLGGLALGAGLASLFAGSGLGGMFSSILVGLLLLVGVIFLLRFFRGRQAAGGPMQYAGIGAGGANSPASPQFSGPQPLAAPSTENPAHIPAGFDSEGFLRHAKLNFLRLQAANDAGNIEDIRGFTTPEMFAEIKLQMQERASHLQQTDVVKLDGQLLDVTDEGSRHLASVRFFGAIRENAETAPVPFDEVWHLTKPADGGTGWVIAGIQQRE